MLNTFASFPDDALGDTIQRFKIDHVNVVRVSRYCAQLAVPNSSSNTNSKYFNSCPVYLKAGYSHAIVGWSSGQHYQHPLLSTASE